MLFRWILPLAIVGLLATPAMAAHCPLDAKAIDNALGKMQLDDQTRAEVKTMRDEGLELHNAGKHKESANMLAEAMRILLESL